MVLNRLVNAIPGSQGTKVFVGTTVALGLCALSFFGGKAKKSGHGAFDSDRPQAVQLSMDEAEKNRLKKISPLPEKRWDPKSIGMDRCVGISEMVYRHTINRAIVCQTWKIKTVRNIQWFTFVSLLLCYLFYFSLQTYTINIVYYYEHTQVVVVNTMFLFFLFPARKDYNKTTSQVTAK